MGTVSWLVSIGQLSMVATGPWPVGIRDERHSNRAVTNCHLSAKWRSSMQMRRKGVSPGCCRRRKMPRRVVRRFI